jgi:hypothetical protein
MTMQDRLSAAAEAAEYTVVKEIWGGERPPHGHPEWARFRKQVERARLNAIHREGYRIWGEKLRRILDDEIFRD